jgi:hypothetical protein
MLMERSFFKADHLPAFLACFLCFGLSLYFDPSFAADQPIAAAGTCPKR